MSEFPSKAYQKLCIENADRLREEWEKQGPKYLDMMAVLDSGVFEKVAPLFIPKIIDIWDVVWLPRLDQLIEMIKEQGWFLAGLHERPDGSWYVEVGRKPKEFVWAECRTAEGPDPETALLRAWLEVVKDVA